MSQCEDLRIPGHSISGGLREQPVEKRGRFSTGRKLPIVLIVLGFLAAVVEPDWGQAGVAADDPSGQSDQIDLKLAELRKAVKAAASPERTRGLISEAFSLIDEALAADEYTAAIRTAALAVETAETLGNEHISAVCARRKDEVSNIAKEAKKLSKQMEKLRKHPNDKAANFDVGHFRCIVAGDWERGLPLLARGSNSNWGAASRRDLGGPADADGQIAAGSDWAGLIVGEKGAGKRALALRAAHWYRKALKQAAGDSRTKAAAAMESLPICYLTDMDEFDVKAGPWPMEKHGDVGSGRPIEVNGFKYQLGIGLHPPHSSEAVIKYRLNGRYKTLVTGVAINVLVDEFGGSITFVVIGDDEVLWKSPPIKSRRTVVPCEANLKGVKILQLKTQAEGSSHSGHAVWLDPYLLK